MPWNTERDHYRKFLLSSGRYTPDGSDIHAGDLVFWGEWEPPSEIVTTWPPARRLPGTLHKPFWFNAPATEIGQNTDPWVWGDHMLYSNCKQGTQGSLRRLTRGSVLCFGSKFDDDFCADTVMVIASVEPWTPLDHDSLDASLAFHVCTAESLAAGDPYCRVGGELVIYRGATFEDPVNGMYSFVPALPDATRHPHFERPAVSLPGLINPTSWRVPRGSRRDLPQDEVLAAWESLRRQVVDAGLVLGTHLDTPPLR